MKRDEQVKKQDGNCYSSSLLLEPTGLVLHSREKADAMYTKLARKRV